MLPYFLVQGLPLDLVEQGFLPSRTGLALRLPVQLTDLDRTLIIVKYDGDAAILFVHSRSLPPYLDNGGSSS